MPGAESTANGQAAEQLLARGLESLWAEQPDQSQLAQTPAATQQARPPKSAAHRHRDMLTRRSRSLELDESSLPFTSSAQQAQLAEAPAEAPGRSWIKPFSRRKKEKKDAKGPDEEVSLEASGRTVFSAAQLQCAAGIGSGADRQQALPQAAAVMNGAVKQQTASSSEASSTGRRLFSRYSEPVKDRPASAAVQASSKADMLAVEGRSKSSTEGSGSSSRWHLNPFSKPGKSPAAPEPQQQAVTGEQREIRVLYA